MAPSPKQLRWVKQVRVSSATAPSAPQGPFPLPTPRERLVAALADRLRTVAQLARVFGLSQPTMLEQVRRALRDGLVAEVPVADAEKRFPGERYYAPTVPVIRQPDRELLETACRGLADDVARAMAQSWGDVHAAFAVTHLAREGWTFEALAPYLHETVARLVVHRVSGFAVPRDVPGHGLAGVEEIPETDHEPMAREEETG